MWAKLVTMHPDNQNITLETDRTQDLFGNKLKIPQNQHGQALIKNISDQLHASPLMTVYWR